MHLLVAGDARVDAGKTTFAAGLLATLEGGVGFKPRAGNDYWFDHDDVITALADERLYGKDVATLAAAGDGTAPEELNPVHRLWRPTPGRTGLLGEADRTFLLDRIWTPEGARFVVNAVAEAAGLLPDRVDDALPLASATRVDSVADFNDVMAERYLPAFERLAERIAASSPAVVESYGDIAVPIEGIAFDAVAVVGPTRARVYDGSRYMTACEVASGSPQEGQLEERVGRVVEMIEPLSTHELPPLTSDQRSEPARIAEQYDAVYESLRQAARR
jgi:predicted P-loop ATPase/GTPase